MKLRRSKKGFTIVELVIVVGVIGILSAVLIPTFVNLTEQARTRAKQLEVRDAYTAYVAVAVDGFIDEDEAKELGYTFTAGDSVEIAYVKQDKVTLKEGGKAYEFDGKNWTAVTSATHNTPVSKAYGETYTAAKLSTFLGFEVCYTA